MEKLNQTKKNPKWINFLHFYQPANQQKDILEAVVNQSYLPIFKKIGQSSISINITGSLLELFERDNYTELLDLIRKAVKSGKVELTGSCKYHALIPLIPEAEIIRQIEENNKTLSRILGFEYHPKGFFPPEMAYDPKLDKIIEALGFEWIILDEIAYSPQGNFPPPNKLYRLGNTNIKVFFRNRRASNLIMSAVARDIKTIKQALRDDLANPYLVTGMDGETFGHHRIGFEKLLFEILDDPSLGVTSVADFLESCRKTATSGFLGELEELEELEEEVFPKPSTWASSILDIEQGIQFLSWKDPQNPIHAKQWEFLNFVLENMEKYYPKNNSAIGPAREKMDRALASDHFWWASAKPWWSLEMIEDGAFRLLDVILTLQNSFPKDFPTQKVQQAYQYYMEIVSQAAEWQRMGIVRKMAMQQNQVLRIPFKDRTFGAGGAEKGVYYAFIDLLKKQERLAAKKGHYEKAILWRDAIYKLDKKFDIYDAINVIDLLRLEIGNGVVEKTIAKYKKEFAKLRGGQPEQRGH